jgi:4-amino-4-deoxy-L-arabinose transferase-like glycosyltransferase
MAGMNRTRIKALLIMLVVLAAGAGIRIYRINDPFGGYHAMNEAWYASTARNFSHASFLNPTVTKGIVDYKVRPVFPYLSYLAIKVFGNTEAAPRMVSVVFSLAGIVLVYLIGCQLATTWAGLIAASFLAVMPIYTVLGRQAQPDAAYVCLTLATVWLYMLSRGNRRESAVKFAAGIVWGIAIFTKNFAALLFFGIVSAELIESRSLRWLNRRFILFLLPPVLIPAPFIIYHMISHPGAIERIYSTPAFRIPDFSVLGYMGQEILWAVSPPILLFAIIGFALAAEKRETATVWLSCLAAPFFILYFFLHVHSYYMLGFTPFLAIAAALPFRGNTSPRRFSLVAIMILLFVCIQTVFTLSAIVWGQNRFKDLCADISAINHPAAMVLSPDVYTNYRSVFYYYLPQARVYNQQFLEKDKDGYAEIESGRKVFMVDFINGSLIGIGPYQRIYGQKIIGFAAGRELIYVPFNRHSFIPDKLIYGTPEAGAGFNPVSYSPSLITTEIPDGYRLYYNGSKWVFKWAEKK